MIINYSDLTELRDRHKGKKIAYTGGVFDLFHVGHLDLLEHLDRLGDIVVVGITSDDRARFRKGESRPIIGEEERAKIINSSKHVDYVFVLPSHTPNIKIRGYKILKDLRPDFFVFSPEHSAWFDDEEWLNKQGTQLVAIPRYSDKISTTQIIEKAAQSLSVLELS